MEDFEHDLVHLLMDYLTEDEYSLLVIKGLHADHMITAKQNSETITLRSRRSFEKRFDMSLKVAIPRRSFARFRDGGFVAFDFLYEAPYKD